MNSTAQAAVRLLKKSVRRCRLTLPVLSAETAQKESSLFFLAKQVLEKTLDQRAYPALALLEANSRQRDCLYATFPPSRESFPAKEIVA